MAESSEGLPGLLASSAFTCSASSSSGGHTLTTLDQLAQTQLWSVPPVDADGFPRQDFDRFAGFSAALKFEACQRFYVKKSRVTIALFDSAGERLLKRSKWNLRRQDRNCQQLIVLNACVSNV